MNTWKVDKPNRLLTEIKEKFGHLFAAHDLRWSIEHNRCVVNHRIERFCSTRLSVDDVISITLERAPHFIKETQRVLYEDADLLIYDKPPYLTSEKLAAITECSLVHRLDRDTSGVMILAKRREIVFKMEKQFRDRTIHKEYLAVVEGNPGAQGTCSGNMSIVKKGLGFVVWGMSEKGVWSQTHWRALNRKKGMTLLLCLPVTGRTHQIRVHLQHLGHPILGDPIYNTSCKKPKIQVFRPLLHAWQIAFTHPSTHERLSFTAPLPSDVLTEDEANKIFTTINKKHDMKDKLDTHDKKNEEEGNT